MSEETFNLAGPKPEHECPKHGMVFVLYLNIVGQGEFTYCIECFKDMLNDNCEPVQEKDNG